MKGTTILFITLCIVGGTVADLVNHAAYKDTTLEYYDKHDDSVTQSGAMARCWQRGGWLVMPKDRYLDAAVTAVSGRKQVWIGLGDFGIEGAYEFMDGARVTWSNWGDGNPSNSIWCSNIEEDCADMRGGFWNDLHCFHHIGYVCQIQNSQRQQYHYSHFKVYHEVSKSTYTTAADVCRLQNSRLLRISNEHSVEILTQKLTELAKLTFWVSKIEADSLLCYAASSGEVNIENCEEKRPFVCETVEPHNVKVSDEELEVHEFSDLQLHCSAFGFPVPDVTWFHNEFEIVDQLKKMGHSTMKLHGVTSDEGGLYVCRATNVIDGENYLMEAYSTVKVVTAADHSVETNEAVRINNVYHRDGSKADDTVSSFGSTADTSGLHRSYDDTNIRPEPKESDEMRQGFSDDDY